MIEFRGYLEGSAEKHFHKRSKIIGLEIILVGMLMILPAAWTFSLFLKIPEIIIAVPIIVFTCAILVTLIPKSKKERISITPKKIIIEQDYILCVAEKYTETRSIHDVKLVRDFGEFYDIIFPFGKVSDKFICQKSLLKKGSIGQFEELFEGKIKRIGSTVNDSLS